MSVEIHQTAIVEKGAELDDGVTVGAYSIIGPNVKLGKGCIVHPHAMIGGHTTLGQGNIIYQFASVGAPPQDLKYKNEPTQLIIGDNNTIRESVTLQPGTVQGTSKTTIGDRNLFMVYSHVAHDCRVGNENIFANSVALAGHVVIGNKVILGGLSAIHQFAIIGDLAFIGGGAMVSRDVPPFAMVQGDRAKLAGINIIGLRRTGINLESIKAIKSFYKEVLLNYGVFEERLSKLSPDVQSNPEVVKLLEFCRASKRGIVAPRKGADSDDEQL
jgi:UDP-N-acetylglucosamine acyltransferase